MFSSRLFAPSTRFVQVIIVLLLFTCAPVSGAADSTLEQALSGLTERSLKKREAAVVALSKIDDQRVGLVFSHLLEARLYYRKKGKALLVLSEKGGRTLKLSPLFGAEALVSERSRAVKKVGINNKIRRFIRTFSSRKELNAAESSVRIAAVRRLASSGDSGALALLEDRLALEKDASVTSELEIALALFRSQSKDEAEQIAALRTLGDSTSVLAKNQLVELIGQENAFASPAARAEAKKALAAFEVRASFYGTVETLFFGLSLGSVLALAAVGLAITFGVMGVINMAHGELMMLGAYTAYVLQLLMPNHLGLSILLAIPCGFIVAALFGIAIERSVIQFLYGRPLETLLATFGISLILQQMVRSMFSPLNRVVASPEWLSGAFEVNELLTLTYNRSAIIVFTLLVFIALFAVMRYTSIGLKVRAVSQNRQMARAIGVRSSRVDMMAFGLGSGIAGVAGVALSQLTNVGPNLGQAYIVDSFLVVVFGGVGNLWGTLVSGLTLGVANKFLEPWAGAVLAKVMVLVFIILFIQRRPRGLFPQRGRAAEA